ncbi:hypothetical protein DFQ01_110101 [Paenibacillus cellulosilyticus]|uniref:Uncharacterized protein n=1 Tax=Paenibacillus cellulosilyticus TaxID=375489 RepID=A0A2V2YT59_9BACL|nr:hypothetical protein [Paenibacillus cellulosilyticus]PWW01211.1 hypothetical protein DFQ01_110101 [Paenibacillus cellulosilyticus]QKS46834.1 hypothetical protein HUB94_20335 [Paenibacillus cellulosilyticus]
MNTLVVLIGLALVVMHRFADRITIPRWVWPSVGLFLLFMLIQNAPSAFQTIGQQGRAWWPVVQDLATDMLDGLRNLVKQAQET